MALYQQQTTLQGNGKAPTVSYYAGIKAPTPAAPSVPKGEYKFNIDLQSIGNAMIQASRDKKETELGIAKINAAEREKAEIAAEKQLKIDTSNAYAQALANITDQVDQGLTDPLTANRMMRSIDDQFRSTGRLSASEMASIRGSWDGGMGTYQEKTREQWRNAENAYKIDVVNEFRKNVPSANNWSNEQVFSKAIQAEYIANKSRDAAARYNLMPNDTTKNIAIQAQQEQSDVNGYTSFINSFGTNLTPTQMAQNAYTMSFQNAISNGWGEDVAGYIGMQTLNKIQPITSLMEKGTESDKKYLENLLSARLATQDLNFSQQYPEIWYQSKRPTLPILSEGRVNPETGQWESGEVERNAETGAIIRFRPPRYTYETEPDRTVITESETSTKRETIPGERTGNIVLEDGRRVPIGYIDRDADNIISQTEFQGAVLDGRLGAGVIARPKIQNMATTCQGPECGRNGTYVTQSAENKAIVNSNTDGMINLLSNGNMEKVIKEQSVYDGIEYPLSSDTMRYAREAQRIIDNDQELKALGNEPATRKLSFRNAANGFVVTPSGRIQFSDNLISFGNGYVSSILTNSADTPQLMKINEAIQKKPYANQVKVELARAMVSNNGQMLPLYDPELHGDLRLETNTPEKIAGMIKNGAGVTWNAAQHGYRDAVASTVEWYNNNFKTPDEEGFTAEDKAKIAYDVFFNQSLKPAMYDIYNRMVKLFESSEEINTDNVEKETGRRVELGTIDINSTEDLPIKFNEDGTWSNFKYATIGADGWTYLVPTINMSAKEALEANKYIARFEGEDTRAVNNAEQFGQRVRQYLINKYSPITEPSGGLENVSRSSENEFNFQEPAFLSKNIDTNYRNLQIKDTSRAEIANIVKLNNEEYESYEKLASDIMKASEETLKDLDDSLNEIGYKPINNEEAAKIGTTLFNDEKAIDAWLKIYNNLGKKQFAKARQVLFIASSVVPITFGAAGRGVYELGQMLGEGVAWLQVSPGVYIPTSVERMEKTNREKIMRNQQRYSDRYSGNDNWDFFRLIDPNPIEFE